MFQYLDLKFRHFKFITLKFKFKYKSKFKYPNKILIFFSYQLSSENGKKKKNIYIYIYNMTPHASYMHELIKNIMSLFQSFCLFFSVSRLNKIRLSFSFSWHFGSELLPLTTWFFFLVHWLLGLLYAYRE